MRFQVFVRVAIAAALFVSFAGWALAQEAVSAYSRTIRVEGIGDLPYYAQNDPQWADIPYEPRGSESRRSMEDGGCGPTALAMAVARQLPEERLPELLSHAANPERGFPYCACSVGAYRHRGDHEVAFPTEPADFAGALPVIFASYATGNNDHWAKMRRAGVSGTSLPLMDMICEAYGLRYEPYQDWEDALGALEDGFSVITTVTEGIFTETSHYLCIAGVADGFVYLLDPLMRSEYPRDRQGRLEVVEPGLVRTKLEEAEKLRLYGFYAIGK
ncbi:MAG: hypothetical protein Q4G52_06115 [Clostridia bacterium]|nr:hypothetical protein [Clostridia bacterium]